MASQYPEPPPAPQFTHTPQSLLERTKAIIEVSRKNQDAITKNVTEETATFDNVCKPLADDENEMDLDSAILAFYRSVSTDPDLRDASGEAKKLLHDFGIESAMREDTFKLVSAIHKAKETKAPNLDPEDARLLDKMYQDFIRNGLGLTQEEKERFKEAKKELSVLSISFSKRLNEENGGIWFRPEELAGVQETVMGGFKKGENGTENEGKVWMTFKYPDLFPVMKYAINPETRRRAFLANQNKCNENSEVFKKAIEIRDENARRLGFKNHAEYVLEPKMAKVPEKVIAFLTDFREKLTPGGEKERARLKELKSAHSKENNLTDDGHYYLWDHWFYSRLMLEKYYSLDPQKIREYFPITETIQGMLKIFEKLFGLEFVEITDETRHVWHEDCIQFRVYNERGPNGTEQEFVGWLYLDLHPREGKYSHNANFNLQPGFTTRDGKRRHPATALVCNLSRPSPQKPSLLEHREVVTLFHELGHGIHNLVAKTKYSRFHGTSVVRDFVEAPSQMLENWCWSRAELTQLSSHYKTGEKIPGEMVDALIKTKHVNAALSNLTQLFYAFFDMEMHTFADQAQALQSKPWARFNRLRTEISFLDPPAEGGDEFGHGEATFGHLMGGYEAGYYGYLWSKVFSADMFYSAFKASPMDGAQGRRYRHMVLEKGGSMDAMELLKEYLGREPNSEAFLKELGLEK